MALTSGSHVGPYEIVAPLGAGGMGEVYRARDSRLNRDVAIKVLPDTFATDDERIARFRREAQLLATLNHPNIGHIYGFEDRPSAIVLELIEGPTLADRIAQAPIPIDDALPIAKQIADALEAAHEQGVIHRDLKPANIKVRDDGTVKVLDFGLAKAFDPTGPSGVDVSHSPTLTARATQLGVILGTAAYMAPEQAKGKTVDRRADIWAFGAVLYEMLAGQRAFEGEDISDTLAAVLRQPVDLSALPDTTPASIRLLIARCLERDVKRRLRDIGEARIVLENPQSIHIDTSATASPQAVPAASVPTWRRWTIAAALAIVASLASAASVWYLKPRSPERVARFAVAIPEGLAFSGNSRRFLAVSPDGSEIAYIAGNRVYRRSLSDVNARMISGSDSYGAVLDPAFAPDGQSLLFWASSDRTLKRIDISGGAATTICSVPTSTFGVSWDARDILFGADHGIMRVSANGGTPELIVATEADETPYGPQLLPDGKHLLFTLARGTSADRWDRADIVVQDLASRERTVVLRGGSDARYLRTGHLVYALGGVLFASAFDVNRLTLEGGRVAILEGVRRASSGTGAAQFDVSDSGMLAYVPGPASLIASAVSIGLVDRKGTVEVLKLAPGSYEAPRVSPNGKQIAFQTTDGKESSIAVFDLAGNKLMRRLTFGGNNRYPVWSADSKRVTFQSDREGDLGLFWQLAGGTGGAERLTTAKKGEAHVPHSWSPNGETLLFDVATASSALWIYSARDKKTVPFGTPPSTFNTAAVFSPDGHWVAYTLNTGTTGSMLYVQPFPPTGAQYQLFAKQGDGPHEMAWSPDGKELFYNPRPAGFEVVPVTTQPSFGFGTPAAVQRPFILGAPIARRAYDVMPDGRLVVLLREGIADTVGSLTQQLTVVLNWHEELKRRVR